MMRHIKEVTNFRNFGVEEPRVNTRLSIVRAIKETEIEIQQLLQSLRISRLRKEPKHEQKKIWLAIADAVKHKDQLMCS